MGKTLGAIMETTPKSKNKSNHMILLVAMILLAASFYDANNAFLIGFFAIPTGIYKLGKSLFSKQKYELIRKFIIYGSFTIIIISGPAGCSFAYWKVHKTAQPVIYALNEYYKINKEYPDTLEGLSHITTPSCPNGRKMHYYKSEGSENFSLTCVTYAFNKHTYRSATNTWINWD